MKYTPRYTRHYQEEGLAYLHDFFDRGTLAAIETELAEAETRARKEVEEQWRGERVTFFTKAHGTPGPAEDFALTPYFQKSAEGVHAFFEEIEGCLVLNRLGHAMHLDPRLPAIARSVFGSDGLKELLRSLGYRRPICLLSVYIPKLPNGAGSDVTPHQESTFAHTDPLSSCVLWIALEDATTENACMYGLPGSHRLPLKYVSRVDRVARRRDYAQMSYVAIPPFRPEEAGDYRPLAVRAGDAVFFHGNYVHCSARNTSTRSRRALSFQFIETADTTFSSFNWIAQPNTRYLYDDVGA